MRNSLLHLLFLAAPLLAAELATDAFSRSSPLTWFQSNSCCESVFTAPSKPKPTAAPTTPATPTPPASSSTVRTPRRPLPAHLFM